MSYAVIQDLAASWERFRPLAGSLTEPAPSGLIVYVAGPTDEGIRMVLVWDDEDSWCRFRDQRFAPVVGALQDRAPPPVVVRQFRAKHLLFGPRGVAAASGPDLGEG